MKHLPKYLINVILIISSSSIILAQQAWVTRISGTTQQLNSVSFASSNNGWAVGNNGIILNTTNGGITWNQQNSGTSSNLNAVSFINLTLTGWTAGTDGVIEFTSNGGLNWNIQQNNNPNLTNYSICISGTNIYTTGFEQNLGAAIEKTTNNGAMWNKINYDLQPINTFNSVNFPSTSSGWIVTGGGRIFHTLNGFILNEQISGVTSPLYSVLFKDNFTGYITGANGVILKTLNGSTWSPVQSNVNVSLLSVDFPAALTGWTVGGNGTVLKTINGGTNWLPQNSGVTVNLRAVKFIDALTGWAVGDSGKIISTQTGGVTGINSNNNSLPVEFFLSQNYPNPFNPSTKISYRIPNSSFVTLVIYDVIGSKVQELVNKQQAPGTYSVEFNGASLASGMYFYKLETPEFSDTKKMILIK